MVMGLDVATNADIRTFQLAISPKHAVFLVTPEGNDVSQETPLLPDDESIADVNAMAVPGTATGPIVTTPTTEGEHGLYNNIIPLKINLDFT